jgi:hypothetical protein
MRGKVGRAKNARNQRQVRKQKGPKVSHANKNKGTDRKEKKRTGGRKYPLMFGRERPAVGLSWPVIHLGGLAGELVRVGPSQRIVNVHHRFRLRVDHAVAGEGWVGGWGGGGEAARSFREELLKNNGGRVGRNGG